MEVEDRASHLGSSFCLFISRNLAQNTRVSRGPFGCDAEVWVKGEYVVHFGMECCVSRAAIVICGFLMNSSTTSRYARADAPKTTREERSIQVRTMRSSSYYSAWTSLLANCRYRAGRDRGASNEHARQPLPRPLAGDGACPGCTLRRTAQRAPMGWGLGGGVADRVTAPTHLEEVREAPLLRTPGAGEQTVVTPDDGLAVPNAAETEVHG